MGFANFFGSGEGLRLASTEGIRAGMEFTKIQIYGM